MEDSPRYRELSENPFFKTNPIPTFLLRKEDFSILLANDQAVKLYGSTPKDLEGKSLVDFCAPDTREKNREEIIAKLSAGTVSRVCKHKLGNGDVIDVNILFNNFTLGDDQYILASCLVQILGKLEESEKKYSTYFHEDISAGFIIGLEGKIIDCNKQFINIFKLKDYEHALSSNIFDFYHGPLSIQRLTSILEKEGKIEAKEVEYVRTDGSLLYALINIVGVFNDQGKLVGGQGYIFDITKIKEAEKETIKAREMAERSNLLKDQFLANISHEIRTPMNAIIGFNGIIKELISEEANGEVMESFDIIEDASNRLMRTIDLIITISKLRSGTFQYNPKEIKIDDTLNNLIINAIPTIKNKNISIGYSNKSYITTIWGDETCFMQIFMNIMDNAVKFTQKGSISVECKILDNNDLCISVTDTGIGMTEEYKNNLFAPFTQENYTLSRKYEGLGLGLSVVKQFVDLSGYTINVDSKKGSGSCFSVTIPKENYLRSFWSSASSSR